MVQRTGDALLRPGEFLGGYRVETLAGEGGFSRVYRAVDRQGEKVALKVPKDDANLQRFRLEGNVGRQMKGHPNVVQVLDEVIHGPVPCIVMEWVDAPPLHALMRNAPNVRFPPIAVMELGRDVAQALHDTAQKTGILAHRDIKPANLFKDFDGNRPAKVGDFGAVKHIDHNLTETRSILGVPSYIAPEIMLGNSYSPQSDMFSLGVVLYLMSTRQLPLSPGAGGLELTKRYMKERIPRVGEVVPGFDPQVDEVIMNCLSVRPQERPASMQHLLMTFDEWLGGMPQSADLMEPAAAPDRSIPIPERVPSSLPVPEVSAVSSSSSMEPSAMESGLDGWDAWQNESSPSTSSGGSWGWFVGGGGAMVLAIAVGLAGILIPLRGAAIAGGIMGGLFLIISILLMVVGMIRVSSSGSRSRQDTGLPEGETDYFVNLDAYNLLDAEKISKPRPKNKRPSTDEEVFFEYL